MGAVTAELAGIAHQAHDLVARLERLCPRLAEELGMFGARAHYYAELCAKNVDSIVSNAVAQTKKRGKR